MHSAQPQTASVAGDDGFGMIEMLVALFVFAVIAAAVANGLMTASNSTRDNRNRIQAANLAAREMEILRQEFGASETAPGDIANAGTVTNPHPLPGQTAGIPLTVDGLEFTVVRSAQWMPAGAGVSACDGGSTVTYPVLAVNVKVTWARMQSTKAVESNTYLTPPKAVVSGDHGYAAVKVAGAAGTGVPGVSVQVTNGSVTKTATTGDDGCVVFQLDASSTPVAYSAAASRTGYVSSGFGTTATGTVSVKAGTLGRTTVSLDEAATLAIALETDAGYALPTELLPVTVYNSGIGGSTATKVFAGQGATTTLPGLWPFTSGYQSWPGACSQSDPNNAGGSRGSAVVVDPGGSATITHRLTPVEATLTKGGVPLAGRTLRAVPASTTACTTDNPLDLGVTGADGTLRTSLPAGTWRLQAVGLTAPSWPSVSVHGQSPPQTVPVEVP